MMLSLCRSPNGLCAYRHPGQVIARCLFGKAKADKLERRKKLWAEVDKGYFSDLHELRRNHGKRMEASDQLTSKGESVAFPRLSGRNLSGDPISLPSAHISLILISMRGLGMSMCDQYRKPFEELFISHPAVHVYELSVLDRGLFRMLRSWIERNLRKKLDKLRHGTFMVYGGEGVSVDQLKQLLDIGNTIVGHVYLLDHKGLIRWRAHASPTERELNALMKSTRKLIECSSNISR